MKTENFEVQIKGLYGLHKNTTIEFTSNGVKVTVSLNIDKEMKKYFHPNFVGRSNKFWVYFVWKEIPSKLVTKENIYKVHHILLHNAMVNCREAKMKMIQNQISVLNQKKKSSQLSLKLF